MKLFTPFIAAFICLFLGACKPAASNNIIPVNKAQVNIELINDLGAKFRVVIPQYQFRRNLMKQDSKDIVIGQKNSSFSVELMEPKFVQFFYYDSKDRYEGISYLFYLSPGDEIDFKVELGKPNKIEITGKGAANNQPLLALQNTPNFEKFMSDTIPMNALQALKEHDKTVKNKLKDYIAKYHPSSTFIQDWTQQVNYFAPLHFYNIKENAKFGENAQAYKRNYTKWVEAQNDLFNSAPLNNNEAVNSPNYLKLVNWFILREKERVWDEIRADSVNAIKTWYDKDFSKGMAAYFADPTNILQEKIIQKYFTGAAADYAYASLLESALSESNPKNLVAIYDRYYSNYPNSPYAPIFKEKLAEIKAKSAQKLTDKMIIVRNNGNDLKTFEDVLNIVKGKTVLLDMWGTWCGPCREEIETNAVPIKEALKGTGIEYLYIANYDEHVPDKWKELIAYFNLEGTHILANKGLSEDIMKKVEGEGYPTYVIIKKDGSFELSKAGYPMEREILIKQLMDAK